MAGLGRSSAEPVGARLRLAMVVLSAAFAVACVRSTGSDITRPGPARSPLQGVPAAEDSRTRQIGIVAPLSEVGEGKRGIFRIQRGDDERGELRINLHIAGTATLNIDYSLSGLTSVSKEGAVLILADGQETTVLSVDTLDDGLAEPNETVSLAISDGEGYTALPEAAGATLTIVCNDTAVTTAADSGPGSLRQAILNANAIRGPNTITFDSDIGSFGTPKTIVLESDLPELAGEVTLDGSIKGRLWQACGATISGDGRRRVFRVRPGAKVALRAITIAGGQAETGGGVINEGTLVIEGVTLMGNSAKLDGGALANLAGGTVTVINSTFTGNSAGASGGGFANVAGRATVTNCTFSENKAETGGALFSGGSLLLRNSILANSHAAADCASPGLWDPAGTHNIIETNAGCGTPISMADPRLAKLGFYNGPTQTFPLGGESPALNLGDNLSAVDENGKPLFWDQRGGGDPRFVAGITDIGAFELQYVLKLEVDTTADTDARACSAGFDDCSLRGAVTLAKAMGGARVITFDPRVFKIPQVLRLQRTLPAAADVTLDATSSGGVTLSGEPAVLRAVSVSGMKLLGIQLAAEGEEGPP